jgi:hypothetical protein
MAAYTPAFINKGAFASGIAALTVTMPAAIRNNDLLLLFVESANQAITTPSGWTEVTNSPQFTGTAAAIGGVRLGVYWRIAAGPEGSVTVADTGDHQTAIVMAFRGVDPASPFDVTAGSADGAATTAMVFPSVTTTETNTRIILAAAMDTDAASTTTMGAITNANLAGITEQHDQTMASGVGGGLAIATATKSTIGATGTSTATGSTSVTHAYMTIALKGLSPLVRATAQYTNDESTVIATGGTVTDGLTSGLHLTGEYSSVQVPDVAMAAKFEVEQTSTTFDNVATNAARNIVQETDEFNYGGRGGSVIHDTLNDRYIYFGGYDGTTRYNHVYTCDMKAPGNPWRKAAPGGTLPTGRNLGASCYVRGKIASGTIDRAYMVIWGGFTTADTNDMAVLDVSGATVGNWTAVTQTTPLSARSYNMRHMVATPHPTDESLNYIYLFGGWAGTPRTNVLVRGTFSFQTPNAITWTVMTAEGAAGSPTIREGAILDYKPSTNKLYLYGGYSGSAYLADFWEYDIATNAWTQRTVTGTAPTGSDLGAGGYDSINNRFWFTGGWTAGAATSGTNQVGYINDVGGSESYVLVRANSTTNQSYPGNSSTANLVDTIRGWLVLKGMATVDSTERYGYIIDFRETATSNFPVYSLSEGEFFTARDATASVYDPVLQQLVAINGMGDFPDEATIVQGGHISQVWAYSPTTNSWRYAAKGYKTITHLEGMYATYDTVRNRIIVMGGLNGGSEYSNEVWSLTADSAGNYAAKRLTPTGTGPSPRWLGTAAFDATNNRALFTMGSDDASLYNQVWELSFASGEDGAWTQRTPTGTATAVSGAGFENDTANKRLYIFGGATNTGLTTVTNQTVYLNYATTNCAWTTLTATNGTARRTPVVSFDATNNRLIAFGGYDGTNVLTNYQYYDLTAATGWTTAITTVSPEGRRSAGGMFMNGKMYIHSGRPNTGVWYRNTWELTPNYTTPASSTWVNKFPRVYNRLTHDYIPPSDGNYMWQMWGTVGSEDSPKVNYANNALSTDFVIGAAVAGLGYKKLFIGGVWTGKPVKVYNGSSWVQKPVKVNRSGTWGNANS